MAKDKKTQTADPKLLKKKKYPRLKKMLGIFFLEPNPQMGFISGFTTAATLSLIYFRRELAPFLIWIALYIAHAVFKFLYWKMQVRISGLELEKAARDLEKVQAELMESKKQFEEMRKNTGLDK
jgi:hypothetical protein